MSGAVPRTASKTAIWSPMLAPEPLESAHEPAARSKDVAVEVLEQQHVEAGRVKRQFEGEVVDRLVSLLEVRILGADRPEGVEKGPVCHGDDEALGAAVDGPTTGVPHVLNAQLAMQTAALRVETLSVSTVPGVTSCSIPAYRSSVFCRRVEIDVLVRRHDAWKGLHRAAAVVQVQFLRASRWQASAALRGQGTLQRAVPARCRGLLGHGHAVLFDGEGPAGASSIRGAGRGEDATRGVRDLGPMPSPLISVTRYTIGLRGAVPGDGAREAGGSADPAPATGSTVPADGPREGPCAGAMLVSAAIFMRAAGGPRERRCGVRLLDAAGVRSYRRDLVIEVEREVSLGVGIENGLEACHRCFVDVDPGVGGSGLVEADACVLHDTTVEHDGLALPDFQPPSPGQELRDRGRVIGQTGKRCGDEQRPRLHGEFGRSEADGLARACTSGRASAAQVPSSRA